MKDRLHLRVEVRLLEQAKKVAKRRGVTLTSFVEESIRQSVRTEELERAMAKVHDAEQI